MDGGAWRAIVHGATESRTWPSASKSSAFPRRGLWDLAPRCWAVCNWEGSEGRKEVLLCCSLSPEPQFSASQHSTGNYWSSCARHCALGRREDRQGLLPRGPPSQHLPSHPLHPGSPSPSLSPRTCSRQDRGSEGREGGRPEPPALSPCTSTGGPGRREPPKASVTPRKDHCSWGIQGQGLLHPITFTQLEARKCQTGLMFLSLLYDGKAAHQWGPMCYGHVSFSL